MAGRISAAGSATALARGAGSKIRSAASPASVTNYASGSDKWVHLKIRFALSRIAWTGRPIAASPNATRHWVVFTC